MPRRRSPPRLYFDQTRQQWAIRDGTAFVRTGCGKDDRGKAERKLGDYIAEKHAPEPANDPLIADVMNVYAAEAAPHLKPQKASPTTLPRSSIGGARNGRPMSPPRTAAPMPPPSVRRRRAPTLTCSNGRWIIGTAIPTTARWASSQSSGDRTGTHRASAG